MQTRERAPAHSYIVSYLIFLWQCNAVMISVSLSKQPRGESKASKQTSIPYFKYTGQKCRLTFV